MGFAPPEQSNPLSRGLVSAMKPVMHARLDGDGSPLPKLNFGALSETNQPKDAKDTLDVDDEEPDLVLLSSSSSEDKSQEDRLADIAQLWDSLVAWF